MRKEKKLKFKDLRKKFLAIIFLVITIFGNMQPIFAISSSGNAYWVARTMGLTNIYYRFVII